RRCARAAGTSRRSGHVLDEVRSNVAGTPRCAVRRPEIRELRPESRARARTRARARFNRALGLRLVCRSGRFPAMILRLALTAVAACGGSSKPAPASTAKPLPPPCISPPDSATPITHALGDHDRVMYCIGKDCFALQLATGTLERLHDAPSAKTEVAHVEATSPELKVCTGSDCKALTPDVMPGTTPLHAATNSAGTIAVVLLGNAPAGKGYAEVWEVAAHKRLASFKYARGDFKC